MKKKLSELIYSKDFSVAQFGYKAEEVDTFLDEINRQVNEIENKINSLEKEKDILSNKTLAYEQKIKKLELENTKLKGNKSNEFINVDNYNNVKLVERISRLEDNVQELIRLIKYKDL